MWQLLSESLSIFLKGKISVCNLNKKTNYVWIYKFSEENFEFRIFWIAHEQWWKNLSILKIFRASTVISISNGYTYDYVQWSCKSLNPLPLYWSKTILITGGMGGTGQDVTSCKLGTFLDPERQAKGSYTVTFFVSC